MKRALFTLTIGILVVSTAIGQTLTQPKGATQATGRVSDIKTPFVAKSGNSDRTVIEVVGLEKPVRVLQISDTHISLDNESDRVFDDYSARLRNAFDSMKHFKSGETNHPSVYFTEMMKLAQDRNVDLIALTGDIMNYPAQSSVDFIYGELKNSGKPFVYTSGNHDWHYEGMDGSSESLRDKWTNSTMRALYQGGNPLYSSIVIGGLNFVSIDNSTYQINPEQLAFFRSQSKRGLPIVLLMHMPIYTKVGGSGIGDPNWGYDTDRNYALERRERWPKSGNKPSTVEFVREVMESEGIVIFAGHTHRGRTDIEGGMVQFVSDISADGRTRMIEFIPKK